MNNVTWPASPNDIIGIHAFHSILRDPQVRTPKDAIFHTHHAFASIYHDAQDLLPPPAWRLLRCGPRARWALLCDGCTDARSELIQLAAIAANEGVPSEWIGLHDSSDLAAGIRQNLSDADPDAAKAAFLIIGYVQFLQLDPATHLYWWEQRIWLNLLLPR